MDPGHLHLLLVMERDRLGVEAATVRVHECDLRVCICVRRTSSTTSFPPLNVRRPRSFVSSESSASGGNKNGRYDGSYVTVFLRKNYFNEEDCAGVSYRVANALGNDGQPPRLLDLRADLPLAVVVHLGLVELDLGEIFCPVRVLHETQAERARAERFLGHGRTRFCRARRTSVDGR